jgi:hypothetical protein
LRTQQTKRFMQQDGNMHVGIGYQRV